MIDGINVRITGPARERLRRHHLLTFTKGERPGQFIAKWRGFTFTANAVSVFHFHGSIHVFHQGANWKDFDRAAFNEAVAELCLALGLHPSWLHIQGVEYGVGITPSEDTALILEQIRAHRKAIARRMKGPDAKGIVIAHGKEGRNYRWKIYDKAHQYPEAGPGRLLRVEIAQRQMAKLRKVCGFNTLEDLGRAEVWDALGAVLLERFDELLITEPYLNAEGLNAAQRAIVTLAQCPAKWVALTTAARFRKSKALEGIYERNASPRIRPMLRDLIAAKLRELNTPDTEQLPVTNSPGVDMGQPVTKWPGGIDPLPVTKSPLMIKGHFVTGNYLDQGKAANVPQDAPEGFGRGDGPEATSERDTDEMRGLDQPIGERSAEVPGPPCATCGRPTGSTRPGSKFCSAKVYGQQAAKKCRNADSNPRHTRAAQLARITSTPVLFDQGRYIVAPERREHGTRPR